MLPNFSEGAQHSDKILAYLSAAKLRKERSYQEGKTCPTVLVVDDEETLANTTAEILNISGFGAFVAHDAKSALDLIANLRPDILLTDVVMPEMNGVELAMSVRNTYPDTAIVLFSGQTGTKDILGKAQADGYNFELLAKPIHPLKLIEHLKKLSGK
ncbi:MAG TPA: response regulator [Terracidiphilus sp.]|nr:response regulator [Terracidiphilus sp.]